MTTYLFALVLSVSIPNQPTHVNQYNGYYSNGECSTAGLRLKQGYPVAQRRYVKYRCVSIKQTTK